MAKLKVPGMGLEVGGDITVAGGLFFTAVGAGTAASVSRNATHGLFIFGIAGSSNNWILTDGGGTIIMRNPAGSTDVEIPSGSIRHSSTTMIKTAVPLSNAAAAATATMTNAPTAGNPTKWVSIDDNGTTRRIPAW